jgi:hypothetical protein
MKYSRTLPVKQCSITSIHRWRHDESRDGIMGHKIKLLLIVAGVAAAAATATAPFTPRLVATFRPDTFTLTGKVSCINSLPEGIWVESNSKSSGFARLEGVPDVADHFGWTHYSKRDMVKGVSYTLHVGCGRNFFTENGVRQRTLHLHPRGSICATTHQLKALGVHTEPSSRF